jgi:hypothetical protein
MHPSNKKKQRGASSPLSSLYLSHPPLPSRPRPLPPCRAACPLLLRRAACLPSRFSLARKATLRTNRCGGVTRTVTLPPSALAADIQRHYRPWSRGVRQLAPSLLPDAPTFSLLLQRHGKIWGLPPLADLASKLHDLCSSRWIRRVRLRAATVPCTN